MLAGGADSSQRRHAVALDAEQRETTTVGGADAAVPSGMDRTEADGAAVDAFAERLLQVALGMIEVLAVHLGDRLGWYRDLAAHGDASVSRGPGPQTLDSAPLL